MPSQGISPESHRQTAGDPLDYSFKDLKVVTDLLYEAPVSGRPRFDPLSREQAAAEYLESLVHHAEPVEDPVTGTPPAAAAPPPASPPRSPAATQRPRSDGRLNSNALRICNNHLATLQGLDRVAMHLFDDPAEVVWLDVSCNQLTSIEEIILKFPKLQVLYLHGNQLASPLDILKLTELKHLQKLTLHGNPIAEKPNHKMWVSAHLPNLRNINFSTITLIERDKILTWQKSLQKQQVERNK